MIMVDGQTTTLTRANNTSQSLRTTVPSGIIKQFDLQEKDKLKWKLKAKGEDVMIIIITPIKTDKEEKNNGSK